jgi:hypothetical protein
LLGRFLLLLLAFATTIEGAGVVIPHLHVNHERCAALDVRGLPDCTA